ncbi:M28 family metallopeptidase [Aquimarina rhabdastrellae]
MKLHYLFPLLLSVMLITNKTEAQSDEPASLSEIISTEKHFVGKLTGYEPINKKIDLGSRNSEEERKIAAEYLFDYLKENDLDVKKQEYKIKHNDVAYKGINIYAVIDAQEKTDEYIVLGAHYDSAQGSPGANDNATGVALVQFIAPKLANIENRSKNIVVVFLDQELEGSIGSMAFAEKIKDRGDKAKVHSVHIIDQIGWDKDGDQAIELESPNLEVESAYRVESKMTVYKNNQNKDARQIFTEAGFNTVGVTEEVSSGDTTPYHNHRGDAYETVNFDFLASTTQTVYKVFKEFLK